MASLSEKICCRTFLNWIIFFYLMKHGQVLLPLNVAEDGATYVNAKQYHGILRRRKSRAKAEMKNKLIKSRKVCMDLLEFHEPNLDFLDKSDMPVCYYSLQQQNSGFWKIVANICAGHASTLMFRRNFNVKLVQHIHIIFM